ncbi:MHS family MFS transporter [Bradyrhizobium sp. INPA01-394B]|uniref:MFS transporter n=1 Tax=Bradyrhizobium campsiandrae TaxID=1729892 RepID=A0ABR7U3L1_9BRAD|nr:MFS transporter [Bradyrhizobium campsiandrae]MBC9879907.1 MHS family MFS transporter [Bradyrhizobium campsiandrae]MBC9978592.1 MFS transporter [Bradyrhizobium campsiandrae]
MTVAAIDDRTTSDHIGADTAKVIFASSLGTVFEWYDFYLYGSLATIISKQFFSGVNETTGFIFALLAFAAGFAVRPFGALFFGRLGDMIGRKYTFLVTIVIMGLSTFVVGILPTYASIGVAAPAALIVLRLVQGLALGGEYGGAATYVAEHSPRGKRGFYTAWIQTTATLGFFLSLIVILATRLAVGETDFGMWGWRIPFIVSIALLGISVWIRLSLTESPIFQRMKAEGKISKAPISEAFGRWANVKIVLIALFGLVAGQAVVWYTGQFYALFFLTQTLKVEPIAANLLIAAALVIGTPLLVICGALSDRVGRKPIILLGFLGAAVLYFPIFEGLTRYANPALYAAQRSSPVTVVADPNQCSFQFNPVGTAKFTRSCDIAKSFLAGAGVSYANEAAPSGAIAYVKVGDQRVDSYEASGLSKEDAGKKGADFTKAISATISAAGYPKSADPAEINYPMVLLMLVALVALVAMVYGPIAAVLVELFPTRIRYTAMSLPYHIGNGWLGGFLPTTAFALVAAYGNMFAGLWYPIVIATAAFVVGLLFLPETKDRPLDDQVI